MTTTSSNFARRQTVATLLPGADFSTRADYSSARRLLDRGCVVALATDCNPGTSYVTSMGFVVAIAVRDMRMELRRGAVVRRRAGERPRFVATTSVTWASAPRADVVILDAPRAAHLAYRPGAPLVRQVMVAPSASWFSHNALITDD